jgi:lipocalin
MKNVKRSIVLLCMLLTQMSVIAGANTMKADLKPVTLFDLKKYLGRWYEVARLPAWFEKGMTNVTATYSLKGNGKVKVENAGLKNGKNKVAIGKAKIAGDSSQGYLKVAFFLSFYADYIIIDLDTANYQWAMVASSYDYLWILSREPVLDKAILDNLVEKAKKMGFDTTKLYYTPQSQK